ncbi:MAG TPA: Ku protein [Mycobacteriales bacterium]|nr:Ku protein [Mycobacteriales bacterium]
MRSNVAVRLGPLLSIPVNVHTAVEAGSDGLHAVCCDGHDAGRVHQQYACEQCGRIGRLNEFPDRAAELDGALVVLTQAEIEQAGQVDEDVKDSITLLAHGRDEVAQHTLPGAKVYYLSPAKGAAEAYAILRAIVDGDPDTVFCTVFAVRGKPAMWQLGSYRGVVTLRQLAWPAEVKELPAIPDTPVDERALPLAQTLVESLRAPFDPDNYQNTQRAAREALIAAKANGTVVPIPSAPKGKTNVVSFLDALSAAAAAATPATVEEARSA